MSLVSVGGLKTYMPPPPVEGTFFGFGIDTGFDGPMGFDGPTAGTTTGFDVVVGFGEVFGLGVGVGVAGTSVAVGTPDVAVGAGAVAVSIGAAAVTVAVAATTVAVGVPTGVDVSVAAEVPTGVSVIVADAVPAGVAVRVVDWLRTEKLCKLPGDVAACNGLTLLSAAYAFGSRTPPRISATSAALFARLARNNISLSHAFGGEGRPSQCEQHERPFPPVSHHSTQRSLRA